MCLDTTVSREPTGIRDARFVSLDPTSGLNALDAQQQELGEILGSLDEGASRAER